ncbi:MAG: hypothetical protein A2Z21_07760 [Candidatus Fraserbacteria bacterium RBG_16_55_9]|uniref:Uncharacterized protein n=1 Tax=Fraserbacteria sp. (strain RBG_16_55_9) TaxID=1817864 RepID=A0A1F5UW15_FRAXR|nr:MAG: hypothetical protein A2Z21_07760 [Candidatus Fraserbacteria bacterium RBG_16_55_9]
MQTHIAETLDACRSEFERTEAKAVEFQIGYFLAKHRKTGFAKGASRKDAPRPSIVLMFEPNTAAYADIGLRAVSRAFPQARVDVLSSRYSLSDECVGLASEIFTYSQQYDGRVSPADIERRAGSKPYDLAMLLVQDPSATIARDLLSMAKRVKARRHYIIDCNFNVHRPRRFWFYRLRAIVQRVPYILEEPAFLLLQLRVGVRYVARYVLRKLRLWERWEAAMYQGGQQDA